MHQIGLYYNKFGNQSCRNHDSVILKYFSLYTGCSLFLRTRKRWYDESINTNNGINLLKCDWIMWTILLEFRFCVDGCILSSLSFSWFALRSKYHILHSIQNEKCNCKEDNVKSEINKYWSVMVWWFDASLLQILLKWYFHRWTNHCHSSWF